MLQQNSLTRLGGTCAILIGVSYFLAGISYLWNPARQVAGNYEYWQAVARDFRAEMVFHLALTLVGFFGLALVPAVDELIRSKSHGGVSGWLVWSNNLAYLGFGVCLVEHLRAIRVIPAWAESFVSNEAYQPAIVSTHLSLELDPDQWLQFGGVGLWVLLVNLLALRLQLWPKGLAGLGLVVAVMYWLVTTGVAFRTGSLLLIGASLGALILLPLWYIWVGQVLRKLG